LLWLGIEQESKRYLSDERARERKKSQMQAAGRG
jgi:hypothetical protein